MVDQFGEAELLIRTNDRPMVRGLKDAERKVTRSTTRMQKSLDRTSTRAASAGQVFGALGAQASALGGTIGSLGGKVASLGGAFASLGTAIFGLPGAILALAAAVGVYVQRISAAKFSTQQTVDAIKALQAEATLAGNTVEQRTVKSIEALADQLRTLQGQRSPRHAIRAAGLQAEVTAARRRRDIEAEISQLRQQRPANVFSNLPGFREAIVLARQQFDEAIRLKEKELEISRQIEIQSRIKTQRDLLAVDKAEEAERDRLREQRVAKEKAAAERVADRNRQLAEQTARKFKDSAIGRVLGEAQTIVAERRQRQQIDQTIGKLETVSKLFGFGIGKNLLAQVRTNLLGAPELAQSANVNQVSASAFTDINAFRSGGGSKMERREQKNEENLSKIERHLAFLASAGTRGLLP